MKIAENSEPPNLKRRMFAAMKTNVCSLLNYVNYIPASLQTVSSSEAPLGHFSLGPAHGNHRCSI